ncbi:unnamed protein product [Moneuplotes crassus]|uniref:Uncharacterized protein n=1 Tax=Euplotes crassus TaxID=5936 RepID=A0AAD1XZJ9_EUPCR|nr:unnamed protein product [Moneuplotes crassus]
MIQGAEKEANLAHIFFHYLNLILVVLNVSVLGFFVIVYPDNGMWPVLVPAHLFYLLPSILYHMLPFIRGSILFNWIAHMISSITLALFVISLALFLYFMNDGFWDPIAFSVILVGTLPGALVSISVLFLLNSETQIPQVQYILVQNTSISQPMKIPQDMI